jgi:hypothetical protein
MIISQSVNKNVSETTIKRLYGFAETKYKFSRFTLTALSEYVGMDSWEDFCEAVKGDPKQFLLSKWDELFYKARAVTQSTVKIIRNRSVIPYHLTIHREFAERDFETFYTNDYSFTSFVSLPGYGKSILLSHLADKFFIKDSGSFKDDLLWFINPGMLKNTDFDLEKWLNEQLGSGLNFIQYFNEDISRLKGKVVVILDGFDDFTVKKNQLKNFLNHLANFISSNEDNSWLKIVLSMRPSTWRLFYEHIRHSSYIKSKLFFGNHVKMEGFTNVPPLSDKEINLVVNRFSDSGDMRINPKLKGIFKFPFYLQVYYQLKEEGKTFDDGTDLIFYELISKFVQEKINLSQHYTEKILLIKKIIMLTKQNKRGNIVNKESLLNDISVFRDAYEELIIDGILIEEKQTDEVIPKEIVRFVHHHIYEYFLFIQIIDNNPRNLRYQLFDDIVSEYNGSPLKLQLLEWAIRHAVINQNITSVLDVLKLKLPTQEKKTLMLFILQTLEHKSTLLTNNFNRIIDQNLHEAFLQELMQLDFLGPCYKPILTTLKRLTSQSNELLIYSSLLAYIAVLELDIKQLQAEVMQLRELATHGEKWLFSPYDLFNEIYLRLNNKAGESHGLCKELDSFINQPDSKKAELTVTLTISYIGAFLVNFLSGDLHNNVKLFNKIREVHPSIFLKRDSLAVYMLNICVINAMRLDSGFKPDKIVNLLDKLQVIKDHDFPDYFNILFLQVKSEDCYANKDYKGAIEYAMRCMNVCDLKNIAFLKVLLLLLLSDTYDKIEEPETAREMRYKLHCLLEEKAIDLKSFIRSWQGANMLFSR